MNRAKCPQCGGAKCIIYSCVCPYLLAFHLRRVEAIEADLRALDERLEEKAQPYQAQRRLLRQIPGVDDRIALAIIAEIGIDMTVFGNARRLAAWAGVCPVERRSETNRWPVRRRNDGHGC